MNEYDGEWITTYTGRKFHYKNPTPDEIHIKDIAHHLSLICRFVGACKKFYSVAEHSIRVAEIVPNNLKLSALLHDAAEAYIGDISRPVKYSHKLEETEKTIMDAIIAKFNIDPYAPEIKEADSRLLATEARDLMPNVDNWAELPKPLKHTINSMGSKYAGDLFLVKFRVYSSS